MKFTLLTASILAGLALANTKPKKYVPNSDGRVILNPRYTQWQSQNGEQGTSLSPQQASNALVVVSTQDDMAAQNEAVRDVGREEYSMAQSTLDAVYGDMQDDSYGERIGLPPDEVVDHIQNVLAKYEIPIGLTSKLVALKDYDLLGMFQFTNSLRFHN
jgi:hypothetical protein